MQRIETRNLDQPWDVDRRLSEMKLDRALLLEVRDVARNASLNATAFHPANAAGTLAYQDGSWALRDRFVGNIWEVDRSDGVEAIRREDLKIKVAFSNVDVACNSFQMPKPRSRKGAGAERASGGGLFGDDLPQYAPKPLGTWALYYLMMDEKGAVELTRPVVKDGTFVAAIERLYLSKGEEDEYKIPSSNGGDDNATNFDPQIARKK
jgi:hypothetical protein